MLTWRQLIREAFAAAYTTDAYYMASIPISYAYLRLLKGCGFGGRRVARGRPLWMTPHRATPDV